MKAEKITPQKAAEWLKKNTRNRPLSQYKVEQYAGALKRGEWRLTHEGIAFNCDGTLVDGQHRLMACIQANTPFEAYVFRGIVSDAFLVINQGKVRSPGEAMGMLGKKHAFNLAASARAVYAMLDPRGYPQARRDSLTTVQIVQLTDKYKGLESCIQSIRDNLVHEICAPSIAAALCWIVSRKHADKAADFFTKIGSGEGITKADAEWHFRKRIIEMRSTTNKPSHDLQAALLIRSWNNKISGTPVKFLRWSNNELFPAIKT